MSAGAIKVPTGEYRFTSECVAVESGKKLYIDPSTWCIHGKYKTFEKYVATESNVTAHLAQIHPFTLGWIADLHVSSSLPEIAKEQVKRLILCNPTLTVFGGDIVSGSGEYLGSDMEDSWFESTWNYTKDKLSNNLWVKGNHDIDPGRYYYYKWFERLWSLRLGNFRLVGFDGYCEDTLVPGSCWPSLSLTDVIWLRRRLGEDEVHKAILVHEPLEQWHIYAAWVFKEASGIKGVFAGHSHELACRIDPHKEVSSIPTYINGTCSWEVEIHVPTIALFMKDGTLEATNPDGEIGLKETSDSIEIKTPKTVDWDRKKTKATIPVRLVRQVSGHYLNLIVLCSSEDTVDIRILEKDAKIEVVSEAKMYVLGKEVYAKEGLYHSWKCSCGAVWNSYYTEGGGPLKLSLEK